MSVDTNCDLLMSDGNVLRNMSAIKFVWCCRILISHTTNFIPLAAMGTLTIHHV